MCQCADVLLVRSPGSEKVNIRYSQLPAPVTVGVSNLQYWCRAKETTACCERTFSNSDSEPNTVLNHCEKWLLLKASFPVFWAVANSQHQGRYFVNIFWGLRGTVPRGLGQCRGTESWGLGQCRGTVSRGLGQCRGTVSRGFFDPFGVNTTLPGPHLNRIIKFWEIFRFLKDIREKCVTANFEGLSHCLQRNNHPKKSTYVCLNIKLQHV